MNENSDIFDILNDNECYFFSYGHLSIEVLSTIFERKSDTILYKNCYLRGYKRIFCINNDNDNSSIASVHQDMWETVYGILIKITFYELDLLKSYHKNYTLYTTNVHLSYKMASHICDEEVYEYCNRKSYFFVHNNVLNKFEVKPSIEYLKYIRNMLNDRKKLDSNIITKPITISCVKINESNNENYIDLIDIEEIDIK